VEDATVVELSSNHYPVKQTPKRGLRQVDFIYEGNQIRALEQNPETNSKWAKLARSGKKVMQFLRGGRYVAVVVDGNATLYGGRDRSARTSCSGGQVGTRKPRRLVAGAPV